jgi:hypothetical protein
VQWTLTINCPIVCAESRGRLTRAWRRAVGPRRWWTAVSTIPWSAPETLSNSASPMAPSCTDHAPCAKPSASKSSWIVFGVQPEIRDLPLIRDLIPFCLTNGIERTCLEDSLRSVRKSSQTWRNALSLRPCYRPSRIVTSVYRGKERHLIKGK